MTQEWICEDCGWTWVTVVEDDDYEDQCPECNSFNTKKDEEDLH